jgi:hypothetical protein
MVQHYVMPNDARLLLARQKLYNLKATSTGPNAWDERAKTIVPVTGGLIPSLKNGDAASSLKRLVATALASRTGPSEDSEFTFEFSNEFGLVQQTSGLIEFNFEFSNEFGVVQETSGSGDFNSEFTTEFV